MPKPIAVALYAALDTCLVIDSGANNTVISPLVNLEVMTGAVRCIPIGGAHLSRLLLQCLQSRGVDASVNMSLHCVTSLSLSDVQVCWSVGLKLNDLFFDLCCS